VELWRTGLALLALWALALARRVRLAAVLALAAVAVSGATGHAMAIHAMLSTPIKAVHLLAVSIWLGGLLWLVGRLRDPSASLLASARRASFAALVAVILVVLSGAAETVLFVPSFRDLLHSAYGLTTLAKVAGLTVLVMFGAHHRFRVLPRLADTAVAGRFVGSIRAELAVMFLVVLMGGLLAYLPPSTDEPQQSSPTSLSRK
jgi:copper transport protein